MAHDTIEVGYNHDLESLELLLASVNRPGSFFVEGSQELPMPKIVVEGVGILAFPLQEDQIKKLIEQAVRAPFGRGEETIVDTTVRKVWQLAPEKVEISGLSWAKHFKEILHQVKDGLGCQEISMRADLYKLLVYDEGGFFLAHRDTEKAPGMFGTLVVVLPSMHRGGELIIRHAGREVKVDLSGKDVSELAYAAFYADCEHEVLPITKGNRVALVYNLIQNLNAKEKTIAIPLYDDETEKATKILQEALTEGNAPVKLAWLLEHEYSKAELSFATLKNADSALAKVLSQAAKNAGCTIHLGIVHIEESGSAEPHYDHYSRRRDYRIEESEGFDVVDVFDSKQYVDGWVDVHNNFVNFGELPLKENELLPYGSLDDEIPDEVRLQHSTGNDGASFERAYHRAALVMWRHDRYIEVLMQAGAGAAMAYFKERVDTYAKEAGQGAEQEASQKELLALATLILQRWEALSQQRFWKKDERLNRSEMMLLLGKLGDLSLLACFIEKIVKLEYDGTENKGLAAAMSFFDTSVAEALLSALVTENIPVRPGSCVELLRHLMEADSSKKIVAHVAKKVVDGLKDIGKASGTLDYRQRLHSKSLKPMNAGLIVQLWSDLKELQEFTLIDTAIFEMMANPKTFDPVFELIPALCQFYRQHPDVIATQASFTGLWQLVSEFLLECSEYPPKAPRDWQQEVTLSCSCSDCKDLGRFAADPLTKTYRYRARQDKRNHLENTIRSSNMDMECVTERTGSPQTLVCTKTQRSYEARCTQYRDDVTMLRNLAEFRFNNSETTRALKERLRAAIARST